MISRFLHHFVSANLASSSIRVKRRTGATLLCIIKQCAIYEDSNILHYHDIIIIWRYTAKGRRGAALLYYGEGSNT